VGKTRTFAGALDWPGWCRSGRDPDAALQALLDYAPRYKEVLRGTRLSFSVPKDVAALKVVERLKGDASTDFGAPGAEPKFDSADVDEAELKRLQAILRACWRTFDAASKTAKGKQLAKGPRGGGRDLDKIAEHVMGADEGYLSRLAWKVPPGTGDQLERTRDAILAALTAAAHGEVEREGPRGGKRWTARYFARRVAWHVLDHAWEIEDRLE
jgi:hypothetical protein